MKSEQSLAEHLRPALDDARIERQWSAIEAAGLPGALPGRTAAGLLWALGLTAAIAGSAAVFAFYSRDQGPELAEGAWLESAHTQVAVRLEDGSRVALEPRSQLRLVENREQRVTLELRSGRARFDVKHDRSRPFAITVGPAEVRVIGTRFELARSEQAGAASLRIAVTEGVVEVRRRDRPDEPPQRIHGGESWQARLQDALLDAASTLPSTEAPSTIAKDEVEPEPEADDEPALAEQRTKPSARAHGASSKASEPAEPEEDASALFSRATLARRAGRMRDAAGGYADLLARFPNDGRAGLTAFELGRIRMDALGDARGAIAALERALETGGKGASFHEDALARIVIASDALGRAQACRDARARYLARYPAGVHTQVLQASCR